MKRTTVFGVGAILLATTGMVQAQSVTFNGDTTGAPRWQRLFGTPPSGSLSGAGSNTPYQAIQIRISNAAAFVAEVTSAAFDTTLTLYQGVFDPTDQFTNWVGYDDDGGAGLLSLISNDLDGPYAEGQYTIVFSGFGNDDFGAFVLFMDGVVIGWGPTTAQQLDELKAALADTGRYDLQLLSSNVRSAAQESLATRDLAFSTKGQSGKMMGNVYAWAKVSSLYAESSALGRTYRSPLFQFGADYAINSSIVAGLSVGFGDVSAASTDASFEGSQTLIQPYLGWNYDAWHGTVSAVYGKIDYNTITTLSGAAGAEGEMLAFSADVGRDFALDANTTITPFASIRTGEIKLTATSGTLAGAGLNDTVNFTEASLGGTLTKTFDHGAFTFGLSADNYSTNAPTALVSGVYDATGWSASTRFGYSVNLTDRTVMDTAVSIGGIGSESINYGASVKIAMKF